MSLIEILATHSQSKTLQNEPTSMTRVIPASHNAPKRSGQCLTPLTAECVSLRSFLIPTKITNDAPFGSQTETQLFVVVVQLCLSTTEQSQPTTISTIFKVTDGWSSTS